MKKKLIVGILGCFLLAAVNAGAEQKLLITEVLDAGQLEGQAAFEYLHAKADLDAGALGEGELTVNTQETRYSLNVGVGHGLEVGASIPYVIYEKERIEDESSERDGFGDVTLSAKYRFLEEGEHPFTLMAGLDVKLDSASEEDAGTGSVAYSPFLAASRKVTENIIGYGVYRAVLVEHDDADEHILTFGLESELSETLTLDTALSAAHVTSSDEVSSYETYALELTAYVQTAPNLYLLPTVAVEQTTNFDVEEGGVTLDVDPDPSFRAGLSIYYLF